VTYAEDDRSFRFHNRLLLGAHCAIIMFDLTSHSTYKTVPNLHRALSRIYARSIPMVLAGNKAGFPGRKIQEAGRLVFHREKNMLYCDISENNCEEPFLWLIRQLSGDRALHFIAVHTVVKIHKLMMEIEEKQQENRKLPALLAINEANQDSDLVVHRGTYFLLL